MKILKLFNGRDWHCRGWLYVAAYSQKDAVDLCNQAYRKINKMEDRLDVKPTTLSEIRIYFSHGCWGNPMQGVMPERGVWWNPNDGFGKPERIC